MGEEDKKERFSWDLEVEIVGGKFQLNQYFYYRLQAKTNGSRTVHVKDETLPTIGENHYMDGKGACGKLNIWLIWRCIIAYIVMAVILNRPNRMYGNLSQNLIYTNIWIK